MRRLSLAVALAALLLAAGCGESGGTGSALSGPEDVVKLYKARCLTCHGTDLKGRMGSETDIHDIGGRMTEEAIAGQIGNGGSLMPPFKDKLTPAQIQELAQWLQEKK